MSEQWRVQRAKALSTKLIPSVSLDTHGANQFSAIPSPPRPHPSKWKKKLSTNNLNGYTTQLQNGLMIPN